MDSAEGDVQEGGYVFVVAEALENEWAEGVGDGCADVEEKSKADEEVVLGLEEDFDNVVLFEVAGAGAGLVGAKAFDSLGSLMRSEEAGGRNVVVEEVVDDWRRDDGD